MWRAGRALLFALALASSLAALDVDKLKPQGYVSDFAHVLDASSRVQLETYAGRVEQATGVQMAIVTIDTLDGLPVEDVANSLYRKWGIGKKGRTKAFFFWSRSRTVAIAWKWATAWSRFF